MGPCQSRQETPFDITNFPQCILRSSLYLNRHKALSFITLQTRYYDGKLFKFYSKRSSVLEATRLVLPTLFNKYQLYFISGITVEFLERQSSNISLKLSLEDRTLLWNYKENMEHKFESKCKDTILWSGDAIPKKIKCVRHPRRLPQ